MTLDYIYHSGFAIEAEGVTVIIDYYKDSSETEHNRGIVHDYLLQRPGKLYVLATHFHPDHFNREILTWKEAHPDIRHIIIFNSRAYIVAEYLQAHGMGDRILLGFDPLERNVKCMKSGYLDYIIAQKCETQAYRGVRALCNLFVFKTTPASADNYMSMDILTAENVNYYIDLPNE